jgi:hypothetical protein
MKLLLIICLSNFALSAMDHVVIDIHEKVDTSKVLSLKQQIINVIKSNKIGCWRSDRRISSLPLQLAEEHLELLESIQAYNTNTIGWKNAPQVFLFAKDINDTEKKNLCQNLIIKKIIPSVIDQEFARSMVKNLTFRCDAEHSTLEHKKAYFYESVAKNSIKSYNNNLIVQQLGLEENLKQKFDKYIINSERMQSCTCVTASTCMLISVIFPSAFGIAELILYLSGS